MIYLKEFETQAAYDAVKNNLPKPNVSLITDGSEVKYIKGTTPLDTTVVLKLVTTSNNQVAQVFDYYGYAYSSIDYMEFDGVEIDSKKRDEIYEDGADMTIETPGEHVFKYRFNQSSEAPSALFIDCPYTSVYIPDGITTIGYGFIVCENIDSYFESMVVNSNNSYYDSRNNCNAIIETSTNKLLYGCKSTVIPNTITIIGDEAFKNVQAFQNLIIHEGVTNIGSHAFRYNKIMETLDLPSTLTTIGTQAFSNCSNLESITIRAIVPPTIGAHSSIFSGSSCNIYVPSESVDAYKTATNWTTYASRIQAIP